MSCEDDVVQIGKKLEKMISNNTSDHASALDMLNTLKKLPMTLEVLQKSRIGMTVNNFRKTTSNEDVITLAKSLIKNWKKLLPADQSKSTNPPSRSNSSASLSSKNGEDSQDVPETKSSEQTEETKRTDSPQTTAAYPAKASDTGDSIRLKCRELLHNALKSQEYPEGCSADLVDLAAAIEECIFNEYKSTDMKYKNRVRSRVANLRDSKNPSLHHNVLLGHVTPERIAVMTAEEMASEEMKNLRAKLTKEAIDDHQMATTGGTKTDLLKCGRCLKRHCTYNQVQTRSADEPMTTFVFCNECGHRWKFC